MTKASIYIILNLITSVLVGQTVIPLYPNGIPNSIAGPDEELTEEDDWFRISKVSVPTLTVYQPKAVSNTGTAVIIVPGGGYSILAARHEGADFAKAFNEVGVTAFLLKYRLPNDKIMKDKSIGPVQDAQQAIRIVRQQCKAWNIDPERIGIIGFSAGGHLASTASTHFETAYINNPEHTSLRPNFSILAYPVISFKDSLTHMGSRTNLLGPEPTASQIALFSNEQRVTESTPPTFIVHAGDDEVVKVENSIAYYEALHKHKVPAELIIYPHGGHGFGLHNPTAVDRWFDHCVSWMKSNGWVK